MTHYPYGVRARAGKTLLTRSDFDGAVRDALRQYDRTDLLGGNGLLQAQLLTRSGSAAATPDALKAMLAETAETLFASERDRRLYRVLELTYFKPALKQEAAAEQLGMSFSTYRRHLAMSVDRLTDWLWQQEQDSGTRIHGRTGDRFGTRRRAPHRYRHDRACRL